MIIKYWCAQSSSSTVTVSSTVQKDSGGEGGGGMEDLGFLQCDKSVLSGSQN